MLYITTPGSSAHFAAGVNTVIVPRYLALDSMLSKLLTSSPSSSGVAGGSFYSEHLLYLWHRIRLVQRLGQQRSKILVQVPGKYEPGLAHK